VRPSLVTGLVRGVKPRLFVRFLQAPVLADRQFSRGRNCACRIRQCVRRQLYAATGLWSDQARAGQAVQWPNGLDGSRGLRVCPSAPWIVAGLTINPGARATACRNAIGVASISADTLPLTLIALCRACDREKSIPELCFHPGNGPCSQAPAVAPGIVFVCWSAVISVGRSRGRSSGLFLRGKNSKDLVLAQTSSERDDDNTGRGLPMKTL